MEKGLIYELVSYFGLGVNVLCECGHKDDYSFDEIHSMLKNGSLIDVFVDRYNVDFDFEILAEATKNGKEYQMAVLSAITPIATGREGNERRKYGTESGLHFLMGVILETLKDIYRGQ